MVQGSRFIICLAGLVLLAAPVRTQFRSSTEIVSVYATVQDKQLRLVSDLTKDDFTITDNGREQPITVFSNEAMPFSVVVMLDRSGSMYRHHFVVRDAAAQFVKRLMPGDEARIGSFGDYVGNRVVIKPSAFSSTPEELLGVLHEPARAGSHSPVWIAVDQAVTALAGQPGRRVVLLFSDGANEPADTLLPVKVDDLIDRVRSENVMVYALGFVEIQERYGREPRIIRPEKDLRRLADDSGGGYFEVEDTSNLDELFTRVADELHRQYWLGFVPQTRDGKVHQIRVSVKKPGLTVRARQSYVAPGK
jgi:Ca-activated chloride channel family protein